MDAVGAAGQIGRSQLKRPAVLVAEPGDFGRVGGDENVVELGAGFRGRIDPGQHRFTGDSAKDLTRKARRSQPRGDDAENDWRLLFERARIKYDWNWLCRDGSP